MRRKSMMDSEPSNIVGRSMSYLDVSNHNEDEKVPADMNTGESVDKSQIDASMSRSPLFKVSDIKESR